MTSTDVDLVSGSLGQGIMVMMSTSMKFTISKSFMTRVRLALSHLRSSQILTDDLGIVTHEPETKRETA